MTTTVTKIKNYLSKYVDINSLCENEEDAWKVLKVFRVICVRQLYGNPVGMRELIESSGLKGIGNRYIMATVWWLEKRGYITREEEKGRKKRGKRRMLLRSTLKSRWFLFICSLDDKFYARIFEHDIFDSRTRHIDFAGFFLQVILLNKDDRDVLISKIMNYPDQSIRKEILEALRRSIEVYEEETEKRRKLMTIMQEGS